MSKMIPPAVRKNANSSERAVFSALEALPESSDWVVFHSLNLTQNIAAFESEADFIILAPGHGIVVVEVKDAKEVTYQNGEWYLAKNPNPTKDPIRQLSNARRALRGFFKARNLLGSEPIATVLWFPNLDRHDFTNKSPGDMQFFEWQIGWSADTSKPKEFLIKSLQEASSWYSRVDGVEVNPSGLNQERISALSKALLNDFSAYASIDGQTQRRKAQERELLDEQTLLLDMVETNNHLYFDGPPGSGKTHLLLEAAKRLAASGKKTLVTCFSLLLADSLELSVGAHDLIDVHAWHPLLMKISGLSDNLDEQTTEWFEHTLPEATLTMLEKYPRIAEYDVIIVDEFQDIAANPLHRQVLQELTTSGLDQTVFVLAGDSRQQIMRPQGQRVNALSATREFLPHVVHVRIRRNCRMAPDLSSAVLSALKMPEQFITHRVPPSTDGALHIIDTTEDDAPKHLAKSVRKLLEKYRPQDIVILSMFGLKQSLAARILDQRVDQDSHAKWIAKQLAPVSNSAPSGGEVPSGAIRWHSIFKFKGLDADAVIITDVNEKAIEFLGFRQLSPVDTLFVGMTRAKYECVVLDSTEGSAFTGV